MKEEEKFLQARLRRLGEQRIANCERARSMAQDPDIRIIWEGKARQLRNTRLKETNR